MVELVRQFVIYLIINKINGRAYLGLTVDIKRRWAEHRSNKKYPVDLAIQKYGASNFSMDIIEEHTSWEEMKEAEIWWIEYLRSIGVNLYNITEGGDGILGYQHTKETKA